MKKRPSPFSNAETVFCISETAGCAEPEEVVVSALFFFMAEPIPARMLLAACDLIRVLKQYCILRNFFIRDVRGFRKELSAFSGRILCVGGITKTLLATAMNAF